MSVREAGETLTYDFTGMSISVYGTEEASSSNKANSSFILDGSTPHLHQESMTVRTPNTLLYVSPLLEDAQHVLVIQNLVAGDELQLDYFEVTGSATLGKESTPASLLLPRTIRTRSERLQPAVIAGLALAAVAVLLGFIILFVFWRREYLRKRKEKLVHSKVQLQSQDDAQRVPFLEERPRIEPFTTTSVPSGPSQSSHTSRVPAPAVMTVTPIHPRPSREQVVATSSSRRDEKRPLPDTTVYTMESISRLNLGLELNPRDHSVVGQPSNYESETGVNPQNRANDGGVSLLGSSETINPKVLRLPPDYRRFYSPESSQA